MRWWPRQVPRWGYLCDDGGLQDENIHVKADRLKASGVTLTEIAVDSGVDDELFQRNQNLDAHLTRIGLGHHDAEHSGAHNLDCWDERVTEAIAQHVRVLGIEPARSG